MKTERITIHELTFELVKEILLYRLNSDLVFYKTAESVPKIISHQSRPQTRIPLTTPIRESMSTPENVDMRICAACKKPEASSILLKPCTKCQSTFYCSCECQADDWKLHEIECKKKRDEAPYERGVFKLTTSMDDIETMTLAISRTKSATAQDLEALFIMFFHHYYHQRYG